MIAGKGHEQGQEFAGGRKEPFDDVTVAREALRSLGPRSSSGAAREPRVRPAPMRHGFVAPGRAAWVRS